MTIDANVRFFHINSFFFLLFHLLFSVGIIFYEYLHIKRKLNSLVNADVFDLSTKHPDYIYIKYHIYKESMLKKKHEELADKVRGRYSNSDKLKI